MRKAHEHDADNANDTAHLTNSVPVSLLGLIVKLTLLSEAPQPVLMIVQLPAMHNGFGKFRLPAPSDTK